MSITDFDKYYMNFPPFDREDDFITFWEKATADIKKIPLELSVRKNTKTTGSFTSTTLTFKSFMKTQISGTLLTPKHANNVPVIIAVHDYNRKQEIDESLLDDELAYFFVMLRGHSILNETDIDDDDKEELSPGYLIENILDKETYYVKAVYLDILRSIDALRLVTQLDCAKIGIIGKGLGAAASLFTAVNSQRVAALVLDSPSFCYLSVSQNKSKDDTAREINDYIATAKNMKKKIKTNLTYFDALNFSDMLQCPALVIVGFKDLLSPPECSFALFNHLLCEKTMEIFPDEGNTTGGDKQFKKSIQWIKKTIMNQ